MKSIVQIVISSILEKVADGSKKGLKTTGRDKNSHDVLKHTLKTGHNAFTMYNTNIIFGLLTLKKRCLSFIKL